MNYINSKNCEHLATYLRYGVSISIQVGCKFINFLLVCWNLLLHPTIL